jgi:hypothetical protein
VLLAPYPSLHLMILTLLPPSLPVRPTCDQPRIRSSLLNLSDVESLDILEPDVLSQHFYSSHFYSSNSSFHSSIPLFFKVTSHPFSLPRTFDLSKEPSSASEALAQPDDLLYACPFPGFPATDLTKYLRILVALYSLRQSAYKFYTLLASLLVDIGLTCCKFDHGIFYGVCRDWQG